MWLFFACFVFAAINESPKPLPISAHNCYESNTTSNARLIEAVKLGIDNIEIDLGWDAKNQRLIVGHDSTPVGDAVYPTFQTYVQPLLDAPARADRAPTVLSIDWKTSQPEAVAQFHAFLLEHAAIFSSAPKAESSLLTARRLTVCFTGSEEAKNAYDALIPAGGTYLAFRDRVFGAGDFKPKPQDYAPSHATAYHRFLTFHWAVVEKGAPLLARKWTDAHAERLRAIVDQAHVQGFRVRFYCLNATGNRAYRLPSAEAAAIRWRAGAKAGVDWVASDDYHAIVHELLEKNR